MSFKIASHNAGASSRLLRDGLETQRIILDSSRSSYASSENSIILNWGISWTPKHLKNVGVWLNHPSAVKKASNKLLCFKTLQTCGVPVPEFTDDRREAERFLNEDRRTVVVRHILNGGGGAGIEIIDPPKLEERSKQLPYAPLYTTYVQKEHEYRVYVLPNGEVFARQKRRRKATPDEEVNWQIRNHKNGFIFADNMSFHPEGLEELGFNAVSALGLLFGAVDIIYNRQQNQMYVLEVNTAPGIEGTVAKRFIEAFKQVRESIQKSRNRV